MRFFIVGVIFAAIAFFVFHNSPEDIAKKKVEYEVKINNPQIVQLPSIDGCDIKYVKTYSPRNPSVAIGSELKRHEFYIAKCGATQTTTNLEQRGKVQTPVPTIIDTNNK